jgi:hypothetical protein
VTDIVSKNKREAMATAWGLLNDASMFDMPLPASSRVKRAMEQLGHFMDDADEHVGLIRARWLCP